MNRPGGNPMTADAAAREALARIEMNLSPWKGDDAFLDVWQNAGAELLAALALDAPARAALLAWLLPEVAAKLEAAIEASEPDCRWTPDPDGIEICDEHSEIVHGPEGCEDSPRWWKAKAINVVLAALTDPATDGGVK